jgi:serine/threonine-protein kinase
MLKDGMFIQNRYEIISRIGSGGMADVYKAKDHKLNRFVAVKVLKPEFREDREFISKFRVEAQSAAGLAHANIVNIYDVGEEAGINFIVMELVEGITLKEYINNKGRLSVREATSIALQISAGLEAAHNNGIVHRDVKPQNIIISTDGKVKVADFGIARASSANTINSSVMGSVHYSSPEQSRGGYSGAKSDIYSLGITMYEMLTGQLPFDGDTAVAVALQHLQEEVRGPQELVPDIPYSTNQIVLKCTRKSPDRRYDNMTELIRDLRESLVNPDGDFVTQKVVDQMSRTRIMSREELDQINAEQKMPSYDESMDVGAAAGLQGQTPETPATPATKKYRPGSYYQTSGYQDVPGGRAEEEPYDGYGADEDPGAGDYDPYFDAYDDPSDYAIHEGNYRLDEDLSGRAEKEWDHEDDDVGLNPRLERIVTVGGIIVAVLIGCIFLALLANAFGLVSFVHSSRKKDNIVTEKVTEKQTEKQTTAQPVFVPDIRGKSESDALELLQSYGLVGSKKGEAESTEYSAGEVCEQNPEKGASVEKGSTVEYQVVKSEEITLSDLTDVEQSQAQAWLLTQGLQYTIDTSRQSDQVSVGHVITTEPTAGAVLQPGDTVTLYINQQPQTEAEYVTMSDLYYYTKEVATENLELLGLVAEYEYEANNDGVLENFVIRQSVEAGTRVAKGTHVTLVISTGPGAVEDTTQPIEILDDTADNTAGSTTGSTVWRCDASLQEPTGYAGQPVRITLKQNGTETVMFEGTTSFPYRLQVEGTAGVDSGTAYIYLLDPTTGEVTTTIEYPGINFSQVNE